LTILNGFENAISEKIINLNSHIKISAFSKRTLPSYDITLPKIESKLGQFLKSVSPFISKYAVISSKRLDEGITLIGVMPAMDNSGTEKYIIEGKYEFGETNNLPNLIIGKKLADRMFLKTGDKITLFALRKDEEPSFENPPVIEQFIIKGIYESGMAQYDDEIVYTDIKTVQKIFEDEGGVSGYNIRINDLSKVDSLAESLGTYLGYPFYSRSIFKVHQNIFTWIELQRVPITLILGLIIIVAVFNIVGTLLMIVLERTNAIGILKSIGSQRKQIIRIFVYQGVYLSLAGIIIGNLIAFILSKLQLDLNLISIPDTVYFISSVPILIEWQNYLLVSVIAFILCLLASLIPSYIASKITAISAIRFD
jgi:lipoprotein-releasing system permease protein